MVAVIAVIATLATCGLAALTVWLIFKASKRAEERTKYLNALVETAKAMTEAGQAYKNVPGLVEGLLRIAKAQTVEIVKLRAAIERMTKVVTRPEDRVKPLEQPTEEDAAKAWDIAQLLVENPGMDPEVATQKVKDIWDGNMTRVGSFIE